MAGGTAPRGPALSSRCPSSSGRTLSPRRSTHDPVFPESSSVGQQVRTPHTPPPISAPSYYPVQTQLSKSWVPD